MTNLVLPMGFFILKSSLVKLHQMAVRAQKRRHQEICGFLLKGKNHKLTLWPAQNRTTRSYQWKLFRKDIQRISRKAKKNHQKCVGTFHSHPVGYAIPGKRDIESGWNHSLQLIYDVCGREARLWQINRQQGVRRVIPIKLVTGG